VRTTSDVLELLDEVAELLFLLEGRALDACNSDLVKLLICDARNRLRAGIAALRSGSFPTFDDERCSTPLEWTRAARAVLAADDDEDWRCAAAAELFLSIAEARTEGRA